MRQEQASPRRAAREALALYLAVAAGAAIGGTARAALSLAALGLAGPGFPWGTLLANVGGSFLIGLFAALTGPGGRLAASPRTREFVMTGFCGGFTTFSIFSLETLHLAAAGRLAAAAGYVAISVPLWLGGVWAGSRLGRRPR